MADVAWNDRVRTLLKDELNRRGIGYRDLAERLTGMGLPMSESEVAAAIAAGGFPAAFMVQCFEAMGAPVISLDY